MNYSNRFLDTAAVFLILVILVLAFYLLGGHIEQVIEFVNRIAGQF